MAVATAANAAAAASGSNVVVVATKGTLRHWVLEITGLLYVVATVALSVYCLQGLALYMENNLFWPGFLASGMQNALIDLFNTEMAFTPTAATTAWNVFDPALAAVDMSYNAPHLGLVIYATYPRRLLYAEQTAIATAITGLRTLDNKGAIFLMTPYCWVDFNRTWEMGHSVQRQARCQVDDVENAAVYMEAVLRNIALASWLHQYGAMFSATIGNALEETPRGAAWLTYMTQHAWTSVDDEAALWTACDLARFTLQWANYRQVGIQETINIENALGLPHTVQLKGIQPKSLGSMWSSGSLYGALANDVYAMVNNETLVRQSVNFFGITAPTIIEQFLTPYPLQPLQQVIHNQLGPIGNFDLKLIAPPPSLLATVHAFQGHVVVQLQSNLSFAAAFYAMGDLTTHPTPARWGDPTLGFFGGSLLCQTACTAQPFIQLQFGFDDSCNLQRPYSHTWTPYSLLFTLAMLQATNDSVAPLAVCSLVTEAAACLTMLQLASAALRLLNVAVDSNSTARFGSVAAAVLALNLTVLQFVQRNASALLPAIETQPMVAAGDPFTAFGWTTLYEWALGQREAVSFESDWGAVRVVSYQYTPTIQYANPLDVQQTLAYYLETISASVSSGLALVAAFVVVVRFVTPPRRVGTNWFVFNRVASTSWMGRPLLVVRGITALLCLASCPIHLVTTAARDDDAHHYTSLAYSTRPLWESMLLAGEATWLTYVLNDLFFHVTHAYTRFYAPYSSTLAWLLCTALDVVVPVSFDVSIGRTCDLLKMDYSVVCSSGTIRIGSTTRLLLLFGVQVAAIVVSIVACRVFVASRPPRGFPTLLLPGAAMAFMRETDPAVGYWSLDAVSGAMCGMFLVKFRRKKYVFDVNLWLVLSSHEYEFRGHKNVILIPHAASSPLDQKSTTTTSQDPRANRGFSTIVKSAISRSSFVVESMQAMKKYAPMPSFAHNDPSRVERLVQLGWIICGFVHIVASLVTNITFIAVTASQVLANDFFWADFDTNVQAFLVNVYNDQLLSARASPTTFRLDDPTLADVTQRYNDTTTMISYSDVKARQELFNPTPDLAVVVANLRRMDPCKLPWMFTQYCWLDFNHTWEMASTSARQTRCIASATTNGAIYLESAMRNINSWPSWTRCWGTSFDVGIASTLQTTSSGTQWLAAIMAAASTTSIADEVAHWRAHSITTFVLQWQNYKSLGMHDVVRIENVLQRQYGLTLSDGRGLYRFSQQVSMKMYWGLASDLWAISANTTSVRGAALLRSSPAFAFRNTTPTQLLIENATVASPLAAGFLAFERTVGPLGAVDLKYILPPPSLTSFTRGVRGNLSALLVANATAQAQFLDLHSRGYIGYFPPSLASSTVSILGGNLFCGADNPPLAWTGAVLSPYVGFSAATTCGLYDTDYFITDKFMELVAHLGANFTQPVTTRDSLDQFCAWDPLDDASCVDTYAAQVDFLTASASTFAAAAPLAAQVMADVAALDVVVAQYVRNDSTAETAILGTSLTDTSSAAWSFVGWCFMYTWAAGIREVVSFQGDAGTIAVISAAYSKRSMAPNAAEIPRDLALLLKVAIIYITVLLILLAGVVVVYSLTARGYIRGQNLFKFSRLVGLVWVGRSFLVIRSLSALIMLNTPPLHLIQVGAATQFDSPPIKWYNTMLASMELQWVVFVLTDVFSFVTRHHTLQYAGKSIWVVWGVAVVWTFIKPNEHAANLRRTCTAIDMDFELVCDSGVVAIGQFSRLCILAGACAASVVVCYAVVMLFFRDSPGTIDVSSLMLSSQAKYFLDLREWTHDGVSFVDKPTALMAGIVSLEWRGTLYLFDVKKWRIVVTKRPIESEPISAATAVPVRFTHAIPLVE
ncbi:Aste57867_23072 [Aphanomyces stellatus]|uniref:Aste57867_23072 protein n=1 Tax=Aphanomyces stellatus TaxID=120398 RepID=A0A485LRE5_9STRA|nr:hypothetical protein As57867_023001 [Aphanomyces stellatus]VFT99720.1 Aste57867_23072 [Aphanomyces stellatus]